MATIHAKLAAIQAALKAPKSQYNEFGRYKYRKAEDILESAKPLLSANGCTLTCTDELMVIGSRYYIKAHARITDIDTGDFVETTAFAREEDEKKGIDGSQVTGASSSYARKYALNGLLCIDDTADSDTTNVGDNAPKTPRKTAPAPAKQKAETANPLMPGGADYKKVVTAHAKGKVSKTGEDYRTVWAKMVNAGPELLEVFDHDVAEIRTNLNLAELTK